VAGFADPSGRVSATPASTRAPGCWSRTAPARGNVPIRGGSSCRREVSPP